MPLATQAIPATTLTVGSSSAAAPVVSDAPAAPVAAAAPAVAAVPAAVPVSADKAQASLLADEAPAIDPAPAPAAPADAPPAVVYALTVPEASGLTADDLKAVETFAREKKLSPEAAQAIVERDAAAAVAFKTKTDAAASAGIKTLETTWKDQAQKLPQLGGTNWKQTVALVDRALVNEPELHALLKSSPLRFHPAVVSYLAKQGARTREDAPIEGATPAAASTKTVSQRWYPTTKKP